MRQLIMNESIHVQLDSYGTEKIKHLTPQSYLYAYLTFKNEE